MTSQAQPDQDKDDADNDSCIEFGEADEIDDGDQALPDFDIGIPKTKEDLIKSGLI